MLGSYEPFQISEPIHWTDHLSQLTVLNIGLMIVTAMNLVIALENIIQFFILVFFLYKNVFKYVYSSSGHQALNTAWKVSKYRVFSGPYFAFGLNTEIYGVKSPSSVRMRGNMNQKKFRVWTFLRSERVNASPPKSSFKFYIFTGYRKRGLVTAKY